MTNTDYISFRPMIMKISDKFINNKFGLDKDELQSIGTLGLVKAFATYDENKHTHSFVTHAWKRIEFEIKKELYKLSKKQKDYMIVSIETPTGDGITVADTLEDDIDVIESVSDKVFISFATNEFRKTLIDELAIKIALDYTFNNRTIEDLAELYRIEHQEMQKLVVQYKNRLRRNIKLRKIYSDAIDNKVKNINCYNKGADIALYKIRLENKIDKLSI